MKKKVVITKETAKLISSELGKLFPKNEVEKTYSLGFKRWMKLSLDNRKALMIKNDFNYQDCINSLQNA
jgi:hypothetical protein